MKPSTTLASLIREARIRQGLSQKALSTALGYPYNVVTKWENAQSKPTAADWLRLTQELAFLNLEAATDLLAQGLAKGEAKEPSLGVSRIEPVVNRRVQALREAARYTASYVAAYLGVAVSHISHIENDQANPTFTQLRKLVTLFGTTYDYLLDGTPAPKEPYPVVCAQRDRLRLLLNTMLTPGTAAALHEELLDDRDALAAMS